MPLVYFHSTTNNTSQHRRRHPHHWRASMIYNDDLLTSFLPAKPTPSVSKREQLDIFLLCFAQLFQSVGVYLWLCPHFQIS
jgi:hypothetical protein